MIDKHLLSYFFVIAICVHFLSFPLDCKLLGHKDLGIFAALSVPTMVDSMPMTLNKCL